MSAAALRSCMDSGAHRGASTRAGRVGDSIRAELVTDAASARTAVLIYQKKRAHSCARTPRWRRLPPSSSCLSGGYGSRALKGAGRDGYGGGLAPGLASPPVGALGALLAGHPRCARRARHPRRRRHRHAGRCLRGRHAGCAAFLPGRVARLGEGSGAAQRPRAFGGPARSLPPSEAMVVDAPPPSRVGGARALRGASRAGSGGWLASGLASPPVGALGALLAGHPLCVCSKATRKARLVCTLCS